MLVWERYRLVAPKVGESGEETVVVCDAGPLTTNRLEAPIGRSRRSGVCGSLNYREPAIQLVSEQWLDHVVNVGWGFSMGTVLGWIHDWKLADASLRLPRAVFRTEAETLRLLHVGPKAIVRRNGGQSRQLPRRHQVLEMVE
jgi:hypothetical protein